MVLGGGGCWRAAAAPAFSPAVGGAPPACRRWRYTSQKMTTMAVPITARPPITPPTIAPTGAEDESPELAAAAVAEVDDEVEVPLLLPEDEEVVEGLRSVVTLSARLLEPAVVRVRIGGASRRAPVPPVA